MTEPTIRYVDSEQELASALAEVRDEVIGVDVERADSHRYFRRAALIQVGDASHCVLIDPLSIEDLSPLGEFLEGRTAVLHAIENDIVPLESAGVHPGPVADTAIAAAMLGLPIGLEPLLDDILGVRLDTDKGKYQRADWEARPLSGGMREYAAGDVFHLPALWRELARRLHEAGRFAWYEQELEATIENARADTRHWTRTKGAGRLSPPQRSVLRALWEQREELSQAHDIAPNRLLHDRTMLRLAESPASDPQDLVAQGRRATPLRDHADDLFAAQQAGLEAEPEPKDGNGRRWTEADRAAYDALRKARADAADEIGIDAGVLCPSRPLLRAVAADPQDADELADAAGLRPWQRDLLSERLWEVYVAARAAEEGDEDDGEPHSDDEAGSHPA